MVPYIEVLIVSIAKNLSFGSLQHIELDTEQELMESWRLLCRMESSLHLQ